MAVVMVLLSIHALPSSCFAEEFDEDTVDAPSKKMPEFESINNSSSLAAFEATPQTSNDFLFATTSRAYVAPIIGASWATLSRSLENQRLSAANGNLFTAGGAFGRAIPTERGQLRIEVEPRYRDSYTLLKENDVGASAFRTSDNWSVLANTWLDFQVTNRFGIYAGGGLGVGGYSVAVAGVTNAGDVLVGASKISTFAWQAGGGAMYALNERVHLDIGYRFYNVADGNLPVTAYPAGLPAMTGNINTSFTASEMLLSVRIYDPFSRWTR